ncbi:unnamed protein product, partial [Choristocarpus tenellus]
DLGPHISFGGKVLNSYGVLYGLQALLWSVVLFPFCALGAVVDGIFSRNRMRLPSAVGTLWSRIILWTMGIQPRVEGADLIPPNGEPVIFVANHSSYLDIPAMAFLPRLSKYLMKKELFWVPFLGWKGALAQDIFVSRNTPASFRQLLQRAERCIRNGNSITAFP